MKRVLLIGPIPPPITGNSLANQIIIENITKHSDQYSIDSINTSYHSLENLGKFSIRKVLFYTKMYRYILKILNADIVYLTPGLTFFGIVKNAPFIYLARILGKEIIVHIHSNHLHREYKQSSYWKRIIIKSILSRANKGIVLSNSLKHNLTPFINEKNIYELFNFVEDELFTKQPELHLDYLRILYISNLIPEKGIFDLLDALLILKKQNIKFTAQIAGAIDKAHKSKIQEKLDALADNVTYLGIIKGEQKREAFLSGNVFILPTYHYIEGQPIAILEAMATANVVLTTNHAGIPDIFEDGINGYYVQKKSPTDIAEKFIKISNKLDDHKNIMKHNQNVAEEKYRVKHFITNFIRILEK